MNMTIVFWRRLKGFGFTFPAGRRLFCAQTGEAMRCSCGIEAHPLYLGRCENCWADAQPLDSRPNGIPDLAGVNKPRKRMPRIPDYAALVRGEFAVL